jgi:hypothetical protein
VTGAEWPPLPGRGLQRASGSTGRRQYGRLASGRVAPAGAEVQVHLVALPLNLTDLAFTVVLAAGLEREQLCIPRERLECCQGVVVVGRNTQPDKKGYRNRWSVKGPSWRPRRNTQPANEGIEPNNQYSLDRMSKEVATRARYRGHGNMTTASSFFHSDGCRGGNT